MISIDIGCGGMKRPGCIGIDKYHAEGIDHVVDLETGSLPFADSSVDFIYSCHCLEHLRDPTHVLAEIGRVAKHQAKIEIWVPYGYAHDAFLPDHKYFFSEEIFLHICLKFKDFWKNLIRGSWQLDSIFYVLQYEAEADCNAQNVPMWFAIKYYKNVVREVCFSITCFKDVQEPNAPIIRFMAPERSSPRRDISKHWAGA